MAVVKNQNFENSILSERQQISEAILYGFIYRKCPEKDIFQRQMGLRGVLGMANEGDHSVMRNLTRVGDVLTLDYGDDSVFW